MAAMTFAEWLNGRCPVSRLDLAKRIKMHSSSLSHLYRGARQPKIEMMQRIAAAVGISLSELLKQMGE